MNARTAMLMTLVLAGGTALAQQDRKLEGDFSRPLNQDAVEKSDVTVVMSQSDGTNTYELTQKNGKLSAKMNGKDVPAERISRNGDRVSISDEDGKAMVEFNLPRTTRGGQMWRRLDGDAFRGMDPADAERLAQQLRGQARVGWAPDGAVGEAWTPPPVMMGVTLTEADASVLTHLGIEKGVGVASVRDNLPAAKAGIKAGDIIVRIDDKAVDWAGLREVLKSKKPGESINVAVIRRGKEQTFKVDLAAYDQKALGVTAPMAPDAPGMIEVPGTPMAPVAPGAASPFSGNTFFDDPRLRQQLSRAQETIAESIKKIEAEMADKQLQDAVRQKMGAVIDHLRAAKDNLADQAKELAERRRIIIQGDGGQRGLGGTWSSGGRSDELRRENEELKRRLEDQTRRLDALNEKLERLLNEKKP